MAPRRHGFIASDSEMSPEELMGIRSLRKLVSIGGVYIHFDLGPVSVDWIHWRMVI
jgi:hypothetical protein